MLLTDKTVLITGGTGSFGRKFTEQMLATHQPKKVIILSRDELKQSEMQARLNDPRLRFFLGDVRDRERLRYAFHDVEIVVHAAALKQVPTLEYNPFEAVKTNIIGAGNVIDAAIECGVQRVVALSSDKAVNPINIYGATKLCAEKLFVDGNSYAADRPTRLSAVRYGNVVGSRGSVIPLFRKQAASGDLEVTDERMTRFWITLAQGVEFVIRCIDSMSGGEVFVPRVPSMRIVDLAAALARRHPSVEVISLDVSKGIYATRQRTEHLPNVHVMRGSALSIPVRSEVCDFAYCFGVLHHTTDPEQGLKEIVRVLNSGGALSLYLYEDHADNRWKAIPLKGVAILRRLTPRLDTKVLSVLCYVLSPFVVLSFSIPARIMRRFGRTRAIADEMPFNFGTSLFSVHADLMDRFGTPIEVRYSRDGVVRLFQAGGFPEIRITKLRTAAGWVAIGLKPTAQAPGV